MNGTLLGHNTPDAKSVVYANLVTLGGIRLYGVKAWLRSAGDNIGMGGPSLEDLLSIEADASFLQGLTPATHRSSSFRLAQRTPWALELNTNINALVVT